MIPTGSPIVTATEGGSCMFGHVFLKIIIEKQISSTPSRFDMLCDRKVKCGIRMLIYGYIQIKRIVLFSFVSLLK